MKTPRIEEMTLRKKIGQTVIFRHMLLGEITDLKDYFSKNVVGATWPMDHPKTVYKAIETELGNPETMRAFVRGLYGDVTFTDYNPFPLNRIRCTDDVYE